jgi:hypothetical protein
MTNHFVIRRARDALQSLYWRIIRSKGRWISCLLASLRFRRDYDDATAGKREYLGLSR